jgi:hypothetical protein
MTHSLRLGPAPSFWLPLPTHTDLTLQNARMPCADSSRAVDADHDLLHVTHNSTMGASPSWFTPDSRSQTVPWVAAAGHPNRDSYELA